MLFLTTQPRFSETNSLMVDSRRWSLAFLAFSIIFFATTVISSLASDSSHAAVEAFFANYNSEGRGHTNNWAVLVCASRYWFNYRVGCPGAHNHSGSD